MADLSTTLAGKKVRSAIGLASVAGLNFWHPAGPVEKYTDWFKRWIDAGAGFIIMPSVGAHCDNNGKELDTEGTYREWYWRSQWKAMGPKGDYTYYWTIDGAMPTATVDHGIARLEQVKKIAPSDVPVIASLFPPVGPSMYAAMARRLESAGADMIEINGGCPIGTMARQFGQTIEPSDKFGMFLGTSAELTKAVVEAVVQAVKIPVGMKMTPQAGYPGMLVVIDAAIKAGAKYVQTTHMPLGIVPPDIYNDGKGSWPLLKDIGANPIACVGGGEAIRIHNFFYTAMATKFFKGKVEIVGGGGIVTGEHAIQSIMLGAGTIELASAFFWRGTTQMKRITKFVSEYMDRYGYKTVSDLQGHALQHIKTWPEFVKAVRQMKLRAIVDASKCIGCGICADNLCNAISMENGFPKIVEDDCAACGLCQMCCPEGAMKLAPGAKSIAERIKIGP